MTDVFIKRGNFNTDVHTGKMPCEEGIDLDWGNISLSHRIPEIAYMPPEVRQETWTRFFLPTLIGINTASTLILAFQPQL